MAKFSAISIPVKPWLSCRSVWSQVGVEITLQERYSTMRFATPGRPVVRGEHDVGPVGEGVDGLGEVAAQARGSRTMPHAG